MFPARGHATPHSLGEFGTRETATGVEDTFQRGQVRGGPAAPGVSRCTVSTVGESCSSRARDLRVQRNPIVVPLPMSQRVHRRRWYAVRDLMGEVANGLVALAPRVEAHAARAAYPAVAGSVPALPVPWHTSCFPPAPMFGMIQRDPGIMGELADRLPAITPAPVPARYIREVLLVASPLVLVVPVASRGVRPTLLCGVGIHRL